LPLNIIRQVVGKDGKQRLIVTPKALENARRQLGGQANAVWCGSKKEALDNADAVVIATEWSEFASMDLAALGSSLRQPVLFDLRNVYRKSEAETAGLEYYGTGV